MPFVNRKLFLAATLPLLLFWIVGAARGATIFVRPGENLQTAISAAKFGDTIVLQSGGVYQTPAPFQPYLLTDKGQGSGYITITSSTPPPPDGTRVTLADRAKMAKCVVRGGSAFFEAQAGAHHYRISGLYFTNTLNQGQSAQLLSINGYDIVLDGSNWPHDIIIDHNWFNPVEWDAEPDANLYSSVNVAVGMVGRNVVIRDNVMKGFGARYPSDRKTVLDSEAVMIGAAPGPITIDNNFLEAWFVAIFIGGADPGTSNTATILPSPAPSLTSATLSNVNNLRVGDNIAFEIDAPSPYTGEKFASGTITAMDGKAVTFTQLVAPWKGDNYSPIPQGAARPSSPGKAYWNGYVPSNIVITHNYFNKPIRWYNLNGTDGKGMFEIKLCDTCLIDGNVFDGKTGWTVTTRNQSGRAPWSVIKNLTISNNLSVRFGAGLSGLFKDNQRLSLESSNIVITNNLMYGDTGLDPTYGQGPYFFSSSYGKGVTITHNTVLQSGDIMRSGSAPGNPGAITDFVFRDNIVNWGVYPKGYLCFSGAHRTCTPGMVWTRNVMIGAPTGPLYDQQSLTDFPSGNWNPSNTAKVGFTDPVKGDYRLLPTSPYYRAASDGKDVGVDMDQLLAHLNGQIPGLTPAPSTLQRPRRIGPAEKGLP